MNHEWNVSYSHSVSINYASKNTFTRAFIKHINENIYLLKIYNDSTKASNC